MSTTTIRSISHNEHWADIIALLQAKADKSRAEAEARRSKTTIDRLKSVLFKAMKGAEIVRCGKALIGLKPGRCNPGTLTLKDGRAIPLTDIKSILLRNMTVVKVDDVEKWFGGSNIGDDLEITITKEAE